MLGDRVDVAADGTITVADDGSGIPVHGGNGLPPIDVLLMRRSHGPTIDGHRPHVHLGPGGLGLFVVNALSERFELATIRDGVEARTLRDRLSAPHTPTAVTVIHICIS